MIKFCCCNLKDHSYFLLVNTLVFILYSFEGYSARTEIQVVTTSAATAIVALIFILTAIVVWILNVIALINFIIYDDARSPYIRFYSKALFILVILTELTVIALIIFEATIEKDHGPAFSTFVYVAGGISLILYGLLIWWSYDLKEILNQEPTKDEQKELVADDTKDFNTKAKAEKSGVVAIEA